MLSKILKTPKYFQGFRKRTKAIGFFKMLKEFTRYNKFYYKLLKNNNVPVNYKTIIFHTAMYTKICRMVPNLPTEEVMKYIPTSVTHGIYQKLKINRRNITYDKYKMYLRMVKTGIDIPRVYYVTDDEGNNIWDNKITIDELKQVCIEEKLIAKPRSENAGKGIHIYNGGDVLPNHIYQSVVYNHKKIVDFQKNNFLSTVRYNIYNNGKSLIPFYAGLNINTGTLTDQPNYGSISANVNAKSGIIITDGFFLNGKTIRFHPKSKLSIKGFKLPHWAQCRKTAENICNEYKELPLVAIDMAITPDGCKILEINAGCGTLVAQYQERWYNKEFVRDFYPNR